MNIVFARIRAFFGVISKVDAIEIARNTCIVKDLPWEEPVWVIFEVKYYKVTTNCDYKAGNVHIRIDAWSGEVLFAEIA